MPYKIVVTGATSGLGNDLVKLLIRETDHYVIALGRDQEKLQDLKCLAKDEEKLATVACDFENPADIIKASEIISSYKELMPVYIVHCAGIVGIGSLKTLTTESFLKTLRVNLIAPFELTQKLIPAMQNSRILLVLTGLVNFAIPDVGAYSMSKAAFYALYRSLNVELDPNIAISGVVFPSIFDSPMQEDLRSSKDFKSVEIFNNFLIEKKLHPTLEVAKFIQKILLHTSNEDFKNIEWDFDNQEHQRHFISV
jgi:NAD(P)-dependent dehydrogenase (short-subunit alcohol dehydrogenase family)